MSVLTAARVDSQSLLRAPEAGPLATDEDFEEQLWAAFLAMARRGCTIVLQFFRSHVAFPPRNHVVDETVTALLADPDAPAIWLTDVVRAVQRHLYTRWLDEAADARTALCGKTPAPLRTMATWSRADGSLFSRSRTGTLPELGTYRLRLGITSSLVCRWCGRQPMASPPSSTIAAAPTAALQYPCPHCDAVLKPPPAAVACTMLTSGTHTQYSHPPSPATAASSSLPKARPSTAAPAPYEWPRPPQPRHPRRRRHHSAVQSPCERPNDDPPTLAETLTCIRCQTMRKNSQQSGCAQGHLMTCTKLL